MTTVNCLATWFGLGFLKPSPGTFGSLGALPFGIAIYYYGGLYALIAAIFLITLIGLWAADQFDKNMGTHDNGMIVIDEVAGQWIALLAAGLNPFFIFLSFILFRFFDITKIWPSNRLEKLPGAWGVMADDIMAGIYAALCIIGLRYAGLG
jgi:phosphatidylglycerophosphatase A